MHQTQTMESTGPSKTNIPQANEADYICHRWWTGNPYPGDMIRLAVLFVREVLPVFYTFCPESLAISPKDHYEAMA